MTFLKPLKERKRKGKKKGKKNQRKIDISDVIEGIDQRNEDALKGGTIESKGDADIFFVDTGPQAKKSRKEAYRSKKLTVEKKLEPNPFINQVLKGSIFGHDINKKKEIFSQQLVKKNRKSKRPN
jgi:hypothetical protein